ncbi:MAG: T9SS type A sorting domain-containing protein [Bacteroidetes bacterium]|nr:T9SS type A sorting domain-containing protein [Bacteroidota bacterium]
MKKQILSIFGLAIMGIFVVSFATAQVDHDIFVGTNGFSPSTLTVNVGDFVKFNLDPNNSGVHYTTSVSIPNGASSWNYAMTCPTCSYIVVVQEPGTYNFTDQTSNTTGSFSTSPTGIGDNDKKSVGLNIYPNPVQKNSVVSYRLNSTDGQIIISNIVGEQVSIYNLSDKSGQINIYNNLAQGLYFCTLWEDGSVIAQRKMMVIN